MHEYLLDETVTPQFITHLTKFGEVRILCDLDPPFFCCTVEDSMTIKGMVHDSQVYIRFNRDRLESLKDLFYNILFEYPEQGQ